MPTATPSKGQILNSNNWKHVFLLYISNIILLRKRGYPMHTGGVHKILLYIYIYIYMSLDDSKSTNRVYQNVVWKNLAIEIHIGFGKAILGSDKFHG